jgi:hypothetical protein
MQTYKKSYGHDEFKLKYATFQQNYDFVQEHNANKKNGFVCGSADEIVSSNK